MSKRISALLLCLFLFCLLIVFPAAGCGQNSSSGSGEEPPVFSPLKVLRSIDKTHSEEEEIRGF